MTITHIVIATATLEAATMVETTLPQTIPAAVPTGGETTKNRTRIFVTIINPFFVQIFNQQKNNTFPITFHLIY